MKGALLLALGACADNSIGVEPVIDLPTNDSASAFPVDALVLAVAHDGAPLDIVSQSFAPSANIELGGIPFGDDLVIHMTGRVRTAEEAYGRSCTISVERDVAAPQPHLYFSRSVKFGDLALPVQPEPRMLG